MAKLISKRSKQIGLPPGTPVFVGQRRPETARVTIIDFDADNVQEVSDASAADCISRKDNPSVTWINVDGLADGDLVDKLAGGLRLHPLVHEDILNTDQRPKVDDYGDYIYLVLKMLRWDDKRNEIISEQVSLVLGDGFVLSIQERPGDVFDAVRERIRGGRGRIRTMKADYLAYALLDAIVDGYFSILENLGDKIEALEQSLVETAGPKSLRAIHRLKRENLYLRKSVWPLREVISNLERNESRLITAETVVFLRDVYDHTIHVIDTMETFRDMLAGLMDLYMSSVSNRMNEVMKVLTIIATIFIPLTFIAGIYGMNFEDMPELKLPWAYPAALIVMAAVAVVMVVFFKRKKWL